MTEPATFESLIAAIRENTAATVANTEIVERAVAGQTKVLEKIDAAPAPSTRAPRKTAAEKAGTTETPPAETKEVHILLADANGETKPNDKGEDAPTGNFRAADFSRDQVKGEFVGWLGAAPTPEDRAPRQAFIKSLGEHFGVKQIFAPEGGLNDDQRKQALFYLRREREGLKVDFSTDYDFDGDPLADQTPASDAEASDDDGLG